MTKKKGPFQKKEAAPYNNKTGAINETGSF